MLTAVMANVPARSIRQSWILRPRPLRRGGEITRPAPTQSQQQKRRFDEIAITRRGLVTAYRRLDQQGYWGSARRSPGWEIENRKEKTLDSIPSSTGPRRFIGPVRTF